MEINEKTIITNRENIKENMIIKLIENESSIIANIQISLLEFSLKSSNTINK